MNRKKEEIIDVEFSVVDEGKASGIEEKHIWVLIGENIIDAKLAKVSMVVAVYGATNVNCFVSQIEGKDIKDAFDLRVLEIFERIPTKEEQKNMIKNALLKHNLSGEIWLVGERYAEGHKSALKLQRRIKGGAHVSI